MPGVFRSNDRINKTARRRIFRVQLHVIRLAHLVHLCFELLVRAQIVALSKQRDEFIAAERKKLPAGKQGGFDSAVAAALRDQLARKGIK